MRSINRAIRKAASIYSPLISAAAAATVTAGNMHGILAELPKTKKQQLKYLADMGNSPGLGLVPGVAPSRELRRQRIIHELLANDKPLEMTEAQRKQFAALGVDPKHVYAIVNQQRKNNSNIALHTMLSGLNPLNLVAAPGAALAALLTRGDTPDERAKFVNDPNKILKTWLLPGYGSYNYYKDLGLARRLAKPKDTVGELLATGDSATAKKYIDFFNKIRRG